MKKDLDNELYNKYFQGKKEIFDLLYSKYKSKIEFFIFNFVKDYQIAEDIAQEVFIYVFQNQPKEEYNFKSYLYFVAKSRAISYFKNEKNREKILEKYLNNKDETTEQDILEFITNQETKKELIKEINKLDDKYKNAIYLTQIEELSYKETSEILGETVQNIKNYVHRGKKKLRKSLLKEKINNDNVIFKTILIIISTTIILTGITYASITIYEKVWKEPIEFSNVQEYLENDSEIQKSKKEEMDTIKPVSIESIVYIANKIITNLGYKYTFNEENVKTVAESSNYYYKIDIDNFSLVFSSNGIFQNFFDNDLFYDFNFSTETISEEDAKKYAYSIFDNIKIGLDNNYTLGKIQEIFSKSSNKECKQWNAVFYQTYDDIINEYDYIDIFFLMLNNKIVIKNIRTTNSDYIYEDNKVQISKEQAINIAQSFDRKISLLDIKSLDAEIAIRDINAFTYIQEKTLGAEDEIKHEEQENGRIISYNGYLNENKLRKVWEIKITYIIDKEKQSNISEIDGRKYYVDITTGEIIGGAWGY